MFELIWIGNTLYPRWFVIAIFFCVLLLTGVGVYLLKR